VAVYRDQAAPSEAELLSRVHIVAPAQPNLAAIPHQSSIDLGGARLVGYDAPPSIRPGEAAPITLYWQTPRTLGSNYVIGLEVRDDRGNAHANSQAAPALGIYPTTRWRPNELVRDPQTITLTSDTPDGEYNLAVAFIDPANPAASLRRVVGTLTVRGRPHYFGAPAPAQTLDARFGDVARLVGYDLGNDTGTVRFVLYWQDLKATSTPYKVFVHVVGSDGTIITQSDQIPGSGAFPTTSWVKGEYLVDLHQITIPLPPGSPNGYQVRIGMYDPATGGRLGVSDASNNNLGDYIQLPTRINAAP
ncbi:MAG TPA: hypothetical protein VF478_03835, partial [Anaerolineae bacterium]